MRDLLEKESLTSLTLMSSNWMDGLKYSLSAAREREREKEREGEKHRDTYIHII